MGSLKDYNIVRRKRLMDNLINNNLRYTIEKRGRSEKITYQGYVHDFPCIDHLPGLHLIKMLKDNIIKKFKVNNPEYNYDIKPNFQISDFNIDAIESNLNKIVIGIDITDCYWFTTYFLGYMDKNMLIEGLDKDEWKESRNVAIGTLSTTVNIYTYEGDKMIEEAFECKEMVEGGKGINNHIRNHVWDVFSELISIIGREHYLMFYVDCIWVTLEKYNEARMFLNDKGYLVKATNYEFIEVDKENKMVKTINITDEVTGKRDAVRTYYYK
jgi:hypothetical protein